MLFSFLHFWISLALRVWYKKVYYHFEEPLPDDAPIIFASTHPNSAVDYLFAPIITRKKAFVLVRGDVFENPTLNRIFRTLYMLPVYRFRDGFATLNKNQNSFESCYEHFDHNGRVLIFSEGICIQEKTVQPLRKGTARLALNYLAQHGGEKVYIVPLSSSYTRFRHFRASVMVNFGKPIDAREYLADYEANASRAYTKLTAEVEQAMRDNYVEVPDYKDDSHTERSLMAMRFKRKETRRKWMISDRATFEGEKQLAEEMRSRSLPDSFRMTLDALKELSISASDEGVLENSASGGILTYLKLIVLSPVMLLAGLSVAMPYFVAKWLVNNKIKDVIFYSTVMILGGAVLYFLQFLILLILGVMFWEVYGLALPFATLMLTLIGLELVDVFLSAVQAIKRRRSMDDLRQIHEELAAWRNARSDH